MQPEGLLARGASLDESVDEAEVSGLIEREREVSSLLEERDGTTHAVGHGLVLDAASHARRDLGRLDLARVDLLERPE